MNESFKSTQKIMSTRRTLAALAAMAMAVLAVVLGGGSPAQAASPYHQNGIWGSSHCLDNDTHNDANLQMWSCGSGTEQEWLRGFNTTTGYFTFTNERTARCITAPAHSTGTITMQFCDAGDTSQQWNVYAAANPVGGPGWYDVWQNVSSGYCMTTPSVANGTKIQAIACDPSDLYDRWSER